MKFKLTNLCLEETLKGNKVAKILEDINREN